MPAAFAALGEAEMLLIQAIELLDEHRVDGLATCDIVMAWDRLEAERLARAKLLQIAAERRRTPRSDPLDGDWINLE